MIERLSANRHGVILAALLVTLGSMPVAQTGRTPDEIARAIVIGQAYPSGNVYVAGFDETEPRRWPSRLGLLPIFKAAPAPIGAGADFFRPVTQDSEEQADFPRREPGADITVERDVFRTLDNMPVQDRNLARYRAVEAIDASVSILGWDEAIGLADISFAGRGQRRPTTTGEAVLIAAEKKARPKDVECTTVPQYLDSAEILLTAKAANSNITIRLSHYDTPGCLGHLSQVWVLDVMTPGQQPRRFEFRHYQGVI